MQAKAEIEEQLKTDATSPAGYQDPDPHETSEWLEALDQILDDDDPRRASYLLKELTDRARYAGTDIPATFNTPYCNTIKVNEERAYPGDIEMERRIKSIIRWNAMAMVVGQNKKDPGIGGHIATYASVATLMKVGFTHFFRGSITDAAGGAYPLEAGSALESGAFLVVKTGSKLRSIRGTSSPWVGDQSPISTSTYG